MQNLCDDCRDFIHGACDVENCDCGCQNERTRDSEENDDY